VRLLSASPHDKQWTLLAVARGAGAGAMIPMLREVQAGIVSSESAGQDGTVINLQHVHAQRMYSFATSEPAPDTPDALTRSSNSNS
jgi:hypothetical protein